MNNEDPEFYKKIVSDSEIKNLKELINEYEIQYNKFINGNFRASVRARSILQDIRILAKESRSTISKLRKIRKDVKND